MGSTRLRSAVFGVPFVESGRRPAGPGAGRINAATRRAKSGRSCPRSVGGCYVALRQICGTYYAHPYAWDEIGFGGPAYPRGYFALNNGAPEPWETRGKYERRMRLLRMERGNRRSDYETARSSFFRLDPRHRDAGVLAARGSRLLHRRHGRGRRRAGADGWRSYGFSVVALDAGPWHDTETRHGLGRGGLGPPVLERPAHHRRHGAARAWREQLRPGSGRQHHPLRRLLPALPPVGFSRATLDGVAADWPISYEELEPYYEQMEREYPVSGPALYPWGKPHGYPYAPLQAGTAGQKLIKGCARLGIPVVAGGPWRSRPGAWASARTASCAAFACSAARSARRAARW